MTDLYQSPGDRLRFEILLKSLTEGSINLAVLSDHDRVLDYYGSLFEERLRAKGESHIEFCASTNSERLVQKFNEILSEITLDQALEKDKKHAPRRFLLFRDSILMQDFELQLLARLVNGFPAGNISVILLINSAGNYQSKLAAFGKNLLQWEVEAEAGEPTKKLTDWVATEPEPVPVSGPIEPTFLPDPPTLSEEVAPVSKLLNLPTKTAWRVPGFGKKQEPKLDQEPLPVFTPTPEPLPAAPVAPTPVVAAAAPVFAPDVSREPALSAPVVPASASPQADVFKRPPRKSRAGWVLLVLLMSIATFGFMYQDLVMQEAEALKKYLLKGTPAVAAPDEAASAAAAAASAASAEALASAELAASVATEAARVASDAEAVASAASAVASQPVVAASVPALVAVPEKKPVEKETVKEAKADLKAKADAQADTSSDQAWVNQLPESGYVVQLAAMDTQEEMRSFQRSNAAYAKARILRTRHKDSGKRFFILVAGPFENKSQADTFMQSSPLLAKGWLRSTKSMKTQFTKP
jgi:septal ring-binding cell division protein DamX